MKSLKYTSFRISNVKPCSINKAYYKTRRVMTMEGRRYRKRLLISMSKDGGIVAALKELRTFFNPSEHALRLFTVYWIPRHQVITTKGQVSRRGGDIDNYLKLTTDFLCNSKYIGHNFDRCDHPPIVNLGIDDQYIIDYDTSKRISPNDEYHIDFHIEILPLADFKEHSFEVVDNVSHYDQTDSE